MKRIFLIVLTISILILFACYPSRETTYIPSNTEIKAVETVNSETSNNTPATSNSKNTETVTSQAEEFVVSSTSQATESISKNTERVTESSAKTTVEKQENSAQVESNNTTITIVAESTVKEEPIIKATASDNAEIADKIIEYINTFRLEEGVETAIKLSGLTEYAGYRSWQLTTNFTHDVFDERAAATALKYGEYIEPSLYGMTGEPYYTANAREAIAKTSFGGTVNAVAKHIAKMTKNSLSHWSYVGGAEYRYIAVGVTYDNGNWYCCIAVTSENADNQ